MTSDPVVRYQSERGTRLLGADALRPMTSNEVLDTALRVYQRLGLTLLRLTALPSVFLVAALAFVLDYVIPALGTTRDADNVGVQALEVVGTLALAIFVAGPVFLAGLTYGTALVVRMVADTMEGIEPDEIQAQRAARDVMPRLFWMNMGMLLKASSGIIIGTAIMVAAGLLTIITPETSAVSGILAMVGIMGLTVGFVLFLVVVSRDALAAPVAVLEGHGGKASSRRSRELMAKNRRSNQPPAYGAIWSLYLVLLFVAFGIMVAVATALMVMGDQERITSWFGSGWTGVLVQSLADLLPYYIAVWTLLPVWACTLTVIYFERRIRLEGWDIERAAKRIKTHDRTSRFNV